MQGIRLREADLQRQLVRLVATYLECHDVRFTPHIVHLCGPLLACMRQESDCFFGLCNLRAMAGERTGQRTCCALLAVRYVHRTVPAPTVGVFGCIRGVGELLRMALPRADPSLPGYPPSWPPLAPV